MEVHALAPQGVTIAGSFVCHDAGAVHVSCDFGPLQLTHRRNKFFGRRRNRLLFRSGLPFLLLSGVPSLRALLQRAGRQASTTISIAPKRMRVTRYFFPYLLFASSTAGIPLRS